MNVSKQHRSLLLFVIVPYMPQWSDQKFSTLNVSQFNTVLLRAATLTKRKATRAICNLWTPKGER